MRKPKVLHPEGLQMVKAGDDRVRFIRTRNRRGAWSPGRIGAISCTEEFRVRCTLLKAADRDDDWRGVWLALVSSELSMARAEDLIDL